MIDPATGIAVATAAGSGGGVGAVAGVVLIILLAIIPFLMKFWDWLKQLDNQRELYTQLHELVIQQRKEIDGLYSQRSELQNELFALKKKVDHLEECETTIQALKAKLDQKDSIIAERDARITSLIGELMQMKERVHKLEIKLKSNDLMFCDECVFKNKTEVVDE